MILCSFLLEAEKFRFNLLSVVCAGSFKRRETPRFQETVVFASKSPNANSILLGQLTYVRVEPLMWRRALFVKKKGTNTSFWCTVFCLSIRCSNAPNA